MKFKLHNPRGRMYIQQNADGVWQLVDSIDGTLIDFETKKLAQGSKKFAYDYIRKWGDIDLASFPYTLEQPLTYAPWAGRDDRRFVDEAGDTTYIVAFV